MMKKKNPIHPRLSGDFNLFRNASVLRPQDALKAGPYTSGLLRLSLSFLAPLPVGGTFSAVCYTEEWRPMADDERLRTVRKRGGRTLHFSFHSDLIWMPGHYTVILSHDHVPFAAAVFDYQGKAETTAVCRPLVDTDMEFRLAKISATNEVWENIRGLAGMAHLRPHLVEILSQGSFNTCCQEWQLSELCESIHTVVTADVPFHAKRLAYCLPKLLNYGTDERVQLDCADWLKSSSPDELLENRSGHSITLYNIGELLSERGRRFLSALEAAVEDDFIFWSLTLCGTQEEIQRLFAYSSVLERYVRPEYRFDLERPSVAETVHLFQHVVEESNFCLDASAENELACQIRKHWDAVCLWSKDERKHFVMRSMVGHLKRRVRKDFMSECEFSHTAVRKLIAEDVLLTDWLLENTRAGAKNELECQRAFEDSMRELETMVGLRSLKEALTTTFFRLRFDERRRRLGFPAGEKITGHLIFSGNPGTGKTTVARLLGKIYHALGLLSKGEVVSTERRELIGEYIGQTEEKVNSLLLRARGNVLFIDEAYNLCSDADDLRDYGRRVIESLLSVLADSDSDLLVVLAGYEDEMERLLQSNPGLRSRFPHIFHFDDYDADELMQIARNSLAKGNYCLTVEADAALYKVLEHALQHKDRTFGNARWVKQFVMSDVLSAMARRVLSNTGCVNNMGEANLDLYRTVECADVEEAARKIITTSPVVPVRPRIGFRA